MTEHAPTVVANCGVRLQGPRHAGAEASNSTMHSGLSATQVWAPAQTCSLPRQPQMLAAHPLRVTSATAHGLGTGGSEPKTYRNRF